MMDQLFDIKNGMFSPKNSSPSMMKLVNFIHLISYTPCVSNPISFNNNKINDTSHTNIHELNQTTTPNIIQ